MQPKKLMIFRSFYTSHTLFSQIFTLLIPCSVKYLHFSYLVQSNIYTSHTLFSQIFTLLIPCWVKYFPEVCAHFWLKIATKDSFKYKKKVKKLLFLTLKFYKQEQRSATKIIYFFLIIFERSYPLLQNISWEWVHRFHWKYPRKLF